MQDTVNEISKRKLWKSFGRAWELISPPREREDLGQTSHTAYNNNVQEHPITSPAAVKPSNHRKGGVETRSKSRKPKELTSARAQSSADSGWSFAFLPIHVRLATTMSSIAALATRRALTRQPLFRAPPRRFNSSKVEEANLEKGAKKDPELYVLLGVMSGAFLLAGWYFGSKPTSVTSEASNVRIGESAMPWHGESEDGKVYKYQYHPHGDKSQPLRAAPSAMNTVIVPNVTLPEDLHEKFNKYGKEEWDY
ncbi:hypothetical protein PENSTE_c002G06603 [Penicillium steckii]|uniref:Uncharacterized protein n=1 Tax=Penicillium steckii TaxID=303698 RepID=A0A1V6TU71_9EURO|nr:hypothetical protein PENSTE_c002G06603 [Penicillium steckii]